MTPFEYSLNFALVILFGLALLMAVGVGFCHHGS